MRRPLLGWLALSTLAYFGAGTQAQTPDEMRQTARYVAAFQNPDGGFAARKGGPSSLGSTSSAIRSLKHVGGSIPDALKCIDYVVEQLNG